MVEVPRVQLNDEQRERVASVFVPHMLEPAKWDSAAPEIEDSAVPEIEKALALAASARAQGRGRHPQRIADSVKTELEEIAAMGERLLEIGRGSSDDARTLLEWSDHSNRNEPGQNQDGFDFMVHAGARLKQWGRAALKKLEYRVQEKIPKGRPYRYDMLTAEKRLTDIWIKYTGTEPSYSYREVETGPQRGGPFATFIRTAVQVIEPTYNADKHVREICKDRARSDHGI